MAPLPSEFQTETIQVFDEVAGFPETANNSLVEMANWIDQEVGAKISQLRCKAEITREQLAEILQACPAEIDQYECGSVRVSAYNLFRIADFFGVSVSTFFSSERFETSAGSAPE